ncbi:MAG: BatD family protein, partial [Leptospirales bacterium]|nr:BatD family protein [Leptospirales bacterium]
MGNDILTSIGKKILSFILSTFILGEVSAAEIKTELSPSRIAAGESAALTVTVSGMSSVSPKKIPAINGLKITYTGTSHSFSFVNGKTWSGTVLNFSVYGEKTGEYKIPPLLFNTSGGDISSQEKTLIVQKSSSKGDHNAPISGEVTLSSNTIYVGEPLIMRYSLYNDNLDKIKVIGLAEQPLSKDFSIKTVNEA